MPPAKMAELIKMPFGLWVRIGRKNHVLDGVPVALRDVAMATNFGTQFPIIGFVGYNFGYMIASDTLFNSRGGFSGSTLSNEDIGTLPWQQFLAFYIWGAHWCHLANTTEPSMRGGDAALCQITLTKFFYSLVGLGHKVIDNVTI